MKNYHCFPHRTVLLRPPSAGFGLGSRPGHSAAAEGHWADSCHLGGGGNFTQSNNWRLSGDNQTGHHQCYYPMKQVCILT